MNQRRATLWLAIFIGSSPFSLGFGEPTAFGQTSPVPSLGDEAYRAEASPEQSELQRNTEELRARIESWKAKAAEYQRGSQEAQARTELIDQELLRLQDREAIEAPKEASAAELSAQLLEAEQDLEAARREAMELDAEVESRSERRRRVPELLSVAKQRLRELDGAPGSVGTDAAATEALGELSSLRREVLLAEIEAYQNELGSYDVRGALLAKRRDRATLRIAYYQALGEELRRATQRMERLEVERENEDTQELLKELTALPDGFKRALRELYLRNEALTSVWTSEGGLYDQIEDVSQKLTRAEARVAQIESELVRLAARVEAVGLADSVGVLLRRHRADAPDIGMYRRFIRMRQDQIGSVQLQQIKLREQREVLADIDALVDEAMASLDEPVAAESREEAEQLLRQLFETQRRYMDALIDDYETYFQKLVDFDASQQELIDRTKDLLDFIDERILWIPSGRVVQPELLSDGRDAIAWLFDSTHWAQLGRGLRDAAGRWWPLHLLVLLLSILFIPVSRRLGPRIRWLGERASNPNCARFAPTGEALGLSLLLAIGYPAIVAYVAWRLGLSPVATQFTRSIAYGLLVAAGFWATLRAARQLVCHDGIAAAHCDWPRDAAEALRRYLLALSLAAIPAIFLIFTYEMRGEDLWRESLGRYLFLFLMLCVAAFNYMSLRSGGALAQVLGGRGRRHSWIWRFVQLASLLVPLALGAAALRGFYWTALQIATRLHFTLLFLFAVMLVVQLAARWSMLAERRALLEEELQDGKAQKPAPKMELSRLMIGTGILVAIVGSLAIWADLLPAARILDKVELWSSTQIVSSTVLDPSGVERTSTEERLVAVTLADLFRSLLIGLLTLALVRALPGLLEATLFRRLGPGERYAYSTIVKYAVVLAGLAFAFDAIGVGWSSIQWLVAAIGLGLGFGLQEIFANFVSGLIILFERPIRVGDTVTVGAINGTVTKIQIRATRITAFDRKELIVPNKEFVTGQLINWSLSDAVLRLSVPVGIAYGSDTERAMAVLYEVASKSPRVLKDPQPQVLFVGFGDSSLSFELRAFVRNVEQFYPARHDLHMSIDKAFREAGIEIAFPQRDLHVRSLPADLKMPKGRPD